MFLPTCFVLYVALRLALILLVPVQPGSDAGWYLGRALTLLESGHYSENGLYTAYWPIGYPGFLSLLFKISGPSILAAQVANLVFASASFWLLYALAKRLFADESVARLAVLLLTLYPNHIAYVPVLLTEHMYTCILLLGCLLLLVRKSWSSVVIAGFLFGLATLVKTQTIVVAPALALFAGYHRGSAYPLRGALIRAVVVGIVALATVSPWTYRNYQVFGTFILVSTNGGMTMLTGNNPSVVGDYGRNFSEDDPLVKAARFSVADQVAADRRARELAWAWIRENPAQFLSLVPKKAFRLWAPDGEGEWEYQRGTPSYEQNVWAFRTARIANQCFYLAILVLSAWAFVRLVKRRAPPEVFLGFVLAALTTALCIVFSGQSRYHFPVMPFLICYAAWIINAQWCRHGGAEERQVVAPEIGR